MTIKMVTHLPHSGRRKGLGLSPESGMELLYWFFMSLMCRFHVEHNGVASVK